MLLLMSMGGQGEGEGEFGWKKVLRYTATG
jgi:hypothetical protein